jgi:hypothetical protein
MKMNPFTNKQNTFLKIALLLTLFNGCAFGEAPPEQKELSASFQEILTSIENLPPDKKSKAYDLLREDLGLIVGTSTQFPFPKDSLDTNVSDAGVLTYVYNAFLGDVGFLIGFIQTQGKTSNGKVILNYRVKSLVNAYPIAYKPNFIELSNMTILLAQVSEFIDEANLELIKNRLPNLQVQNQIPFLFLLSERGDSHATKALTENTLADVKKLQSIYTRIRNLQERNKIKKEEPSSVLPEPSTSKKSH